MDRETLTYAHRFYTNDEGNIFHVRLFNVIAGKHVPQIHGIHTIYQLSITFLNPCAHKPVCLMCGCLSQEQLCSGGTKHRFVYGFILKIMSLKCDALSILT